MHASLVFQHERHGSVVNQRYFHVRPEPAGGDLQARFAQPFGEMLIEPLGCRRRRGLREGRPIAFAAIAIQSELGNDQDFAAVVDDRAVHLALVVFKDAETLNFIGKGGGVILVILFTDAQENAQSRADPADGLLPRGDAGFGDSLHDGAHGKSAGSQAGG